MQFQDLVGFLLPPAIDFINSRVANSKIRFVIAMLICLAVGVVVNLDKIKDPAQLLGSAAIVFATAQITYHAYWKQSEIRAKLLN